MGRILSILGVCIALFVIILIADNARLRKKEEAENIQKAIEAARMKEEKERAERERRLEAERKREEREMLARYRREEKERLRAQEKADKRMQALDDRLKDPGSMAALLKAVGQAEELRWDRKREPEAYEHLPSFAALNSVCDGRQDEIVNNFIDGEFSKLRETALDPISFKEFRKEAAALIRSMDSVYDGMPVAAQKCYAKHKDEVYGNG